MPKKHPNPDDVAFSVQLRLTPLEKEWLTIIAMRKDLSLARFISDEMKAYIERAQMAYLERIYDELIDKIPREEPMESIYEEWDFEGIDI